MNFLKSWILLLIFIFHSNFLESQTVFLINRMEEARVNEIVSGKSVSSNTINFGGNYIEDSLIYLKKQFKKLATNSQFDFRLLPLGITVQYNSDLPSGYNDASMIPAKGLQSQFSFGFKIKSKHFDLQIAPEYIKAENLDFPVFPSKHYNFIWGKYYKYLNHSDIPEIFGNNTYEKIFAGQSYLRYNSKSISVGISTENIWWGPSVKNPLILSFNAPGFLHLTFNTTKPIETKIGKFEWQILGGKLLSSGFEPPEIQRVYNGEFLYKKKLDFERYIAGAILTWQPKWISDLSIGFSKVSYLYSNNISGVSDILPLSGIFKSTAEKNHQKATLGSIFLKYVMPNENSELYFEYGRSGKSPNLINIFSAESYPKAYTLGLRKLFKLKGKREYLQFQAEFTKLQLDDISLVLDTSIKSWYTHAFVQQGYTNYGQVIGSGIGPGSNSQNIQLSWLKGNNRLGLSFERILRNNDFYYDAYVPSGDFNRHWVDISTSLFGTIAFKKIRFAGSLNLIKTLNYKWYLFPPDSSPDSYFKGGWDILNFQGKISVQYSF